MIIILAAILLALITVVGLKLAKNENSPLGYPLVLACYPLFYLGFALYANDMQAFFHEFLFAAPFFLLCGLCAMNTERLHSPSIMLLLASGYILHGVYDAIHHLFVTNHGVPNWWAEFCGTIDILIGLYLLYFAYTLNNGQKDSISESC